MSREHCVPARPGDPVTLAMRWTLGRVCSLAGQVGSTLLLPGVCSKGQRRCPLCGSGCTLSHTRADLSSATSWLSPPFPFSWSSCPGTFSVASVSECPQVLPGSSGFDLMIQLVWVWGCGMGSIIALPRCSGLLPYTDSHVASMPTHGAKWTWGLMSTDAMPEPAGAQGWVAACASGAWMLAPSRENGVCLAAGTVPWVMAWKHPVCKCVCQPGAMLSGWRKRTLLSAPHMLSFRAEEGRGGRGPQA